MFLKICFCRKSTCFRALGDIVLLYFFTFLVVLPLCCQQLRHTPYERFFPKREAEEKERLIKLNAERYNQSMEILRQFDTLQPMGDINQLLNIRKALSLQDAAYVPKVPELKYPLVNRSVAISIITTARNKNMVDNYRPYYLIQTVAYFLKVIHESSSNLPVFLSVCNVDMRPTGHVDIQQLPKWIPVFQRFLSDNLSYLSYDAMLNKEKEDYMFCLEQAMKQNMSHSLIVEDDALPNDDLFNVLSTKFSMDNSNEDGLKTIDDVLFVKLYHPERLLGYISLEWERLPELISLAVLLTLVLEQIFLRWQGKDKISRKLLILIFFVYAILVLLLIGRQNLLPFRRLSKHLYQVTPAPSCCTPAMLYPRAGGKIVLEYLRTVQCKKGFGKDMAIDKLVRDRSLVTRFIQPNLFQHIGHFSAIRSGFINPFLVQ